MKNLHWMALVGIVLLVSCNSSKLITSPGKKDCQRFRTGTFEIVDKERGHRSEITRIRDLQIEKIDGISEGSRARIEWLSDCSYRLTPTGADAARRTTFIVEIDSIQQQVMYFTIYPIEKENARMSFFMTKISD